VTLLDRYEAGVADGRWVADPAQRAALLPLDRLYRELTERSDSSWLSRWLGPFRRHAPPRGVYLWGGVGRGKTFLMDLFHDSLPEVPRLRMHFHRFMGRVHAEMHRLGEVEDPLALIARDFAEAYDLLCFDEFVVIDIADAMILGRLFQQLFDRGVAIVATSNSAPADLYRDGLQRAKFLPAIAAIKTHCEVHALDSPTDWRLRALTQAPVYHHPDGPAAESALAATFQRLSTARPDPRPDFIIGDRPIPVLRRAGDVIWFHFDALCRGPRAVADYIEIARSFHSVLLSGVPRLDETLEDEARRFVHLVDEFYDRRVKLFVAAATAPETLYQGWKVRFEFARTVSRLTEMQSEHYLGQPHQP
jgi:cell division protein ZapE